jgi:HEAT repeat protein
MAEQLEISTVLLGRVKAYDWGKSRLALTEVSDAIQKAYADPAELKKIEKSLLELLKSDATYAGKQFICRKLSIIGTEQSVPTLSEMLTDEKLSDMARYALERIPSEAVNGVLRQTMSKTKGQIKVGIINSLGERGDSKAVAELEKLMSDSDQMIAEAAISALGEIACPAAIEAVSKAKDKVSGRLRVVALDAYLKCADELNGQGKKDEAKAIYKELFKQEYPESIRSAAMRGMVSTTRDKVEKQKR